MAQEPKEIVSVLLQVVRQIEDLVVGLAREVGRMSMDVSDRSDLIHHSPFFGHGYGILAILQPVVLAGREWKIAKADNERVVNVSHNTELVENGAPVARKWQLLTACTEPESRFDDALKILELRSEMKKRTRANVHVLSAPKAPSLLGPVWQLFEIVSIS